MLPKTIVEDVILQGIIKGLTKNVCLGVCCKHLNIANK